MGNTSYLGLNIAVTTCILEKLFNVEQSSTSTDCFSPVEQFINIPRLLVMDSEIEIIFFNFLWPKDLKKIIKPDLRKGLAILYLFS